MTFDGRVQTYKSYPSEGVDKYPVNESRTESGWLRGPSGFVSLLMNVPLHFDIKRPEEMLLCLFNNSSSISYSKDWFLEGSSSDVTCDTLDDIYFPLDLISRVTLPAADKHHCHPIDLEGHF